MPRIVLVSLLHQLSHRFPHYANELLVKQMESHGGRLWVAPLGSADVKALRQAAGTRLMHELADLKTGWSPVSPEAQSRDEGIVALAQYDEELLGNLEHYWRIPEKINSPISDNLFELRREVVDEAMPRLLKGWQQGLEARLKALLTVARGGEDQLVFVEIECAYWLRSRLCDEAGIELVWPEIAG
ncbi:hypothetical protein G114_10375 [Aeromonas diversa CDC 2478-85]|uniref:Uncharacterized protein n=1 Tax=Aeromonas diversa CDC 2478-85 TaxID=1268237 RepID=N9V9G8_9GAMM|nr:hypothetical protein [Aeromonas diversa]ENY71932.1 hypothetical protein G114_10375 [Aeromonas diversa CDC 2478-85]